MSARVFVPSVLAVLALGATVRASDAPAAGVVVPVSYALHVDDCVLDGGTDELSKAFFGIGKMDLQNDVKTLLSCNSFTSLKTEDYKVVVFVVTPPGSKKSMVEHFIYNAAKPVGQGSLLLPGVRKATWVYVATDDTDEAVTQLTVTPGTNPAIAQLGQLASALEGKVLEKIALGPEHKAGDTVHLRVAGSVNLQFTRGTVAESDYVSPLGDSTDALTGSFTITNAPKTWLTVNAGAAAFVGNLRGAQRIKVDNKAYASDPLPRGLALAGVTLHWPYQAESVRMNWAESVGFFVGGVVSPVPGGAIGASVGVRGLSFTAGYAWLLVSTTPGTSMVGDPAVTDSTGAQLMNGTTRSWFLGATFAFK